MPNDGTTNALAVKASAKVGQKIITTKLFAEKMIFLQNSSSKWVELCKTDRIHLIIL